MRAAPAPILGALITLPMPAMNPARPTPAPAPNPLLMYAVGSAAYPSPPSSPKPPAMLAPIATPGAALPMNAAALAPMPPAFMLWPMPGI